MSLPTVSSCSSTGEVSNGAFLNDDWDTWSSEDEDDTPRNRSASLVSEEIPDIPEPFEGPQGTTPDTLGELPSFPISQEENERLLKLSNPPMVDRFALPTSFSSLSLVSDSGVMRLYEADCPGSGERVAVKRVRNRDDPEVKRIIDNELYLSLTCSQCPNVVRTLSCHRTKHSVWTVMELVDGPNLKRLIRDTGALSLPHLAFVIKQVVIALRWLHDHERCHRDLKGENLLVSKDSGGVLLCDFGLAIQLTKENPTTTESFGTVLFMAPEVLRGSPYGTEADIWSLGILTHELAGHVPHAEKPVDITIADIVTGPPPTAIADESLELASAFAEECLQKDQSDRPTVDELACHAFLKAACSADEWREEVVRRCAVLAS